jgi:hypothetical protein
VGAAVTSAPQAEATGCDRCTAVRAALEEALALALAEGDRERVSQLRERLVGPGLAHEERGA